MPPLSENESAVSGGFSLSVSIAETLLSAEPDSPFDSAAGVDSPPDSASYPSLDSTTDPSEEAGAEEHPVKPMHSVSKAVRTDAFFI